MRAGCCQAPLRTEAEKAQPITPPDDAGQVAEMLEAERRRRADKRPRHSLFPEGEEPKATAPTSTQTLTFGSENKVLTLKLARRKVEAHGLALILEKGLKASIRRACSAKLQMPKASETTSDLDVVATVENIPRTFLVTSKEVPRDRTAEEDARGSKNA